jgi:NAD(P)H-dependent FMN reductase
MSEYTIGYFVGSLASGSINRKLSQALIRLVSCRIGLSTAGA